MKNRKFINSGVCCLLTSLCLLTGCAQKAPEEADAMSQESIVADLVQPAETEKNGVYISVDSYDEVSDLNRFISLTIDNQSGQTLDFNLEHGGMQVNDFWIPGYLQPDYTQSDTGKVASGEKRSYALKLMEDELCHAGIDRVGSIQFQISGRNESYEKSVLLDPIVLETTARDHADGYDQQQEDPLYAGDAVRIEYLGCTEDGPLSILVFCIQNDSDSWITAEFEDLMINSSIPVTSMFDTEAAPHSRALLKAEIRPWSTDNQIGSSSDIESFSGDILFGFQEEGSSWLNPEKAESVSFDIQPDFNQPIY